MNIKDLQDLSQIFRTESYLLDIPNENSDLTVSDVVYQYRASSTRTVVDMLHKGGAIVYQVKKNNDNLKKLEEVKRSTGLDNWLIFTWRPTQQGTIVPTGVIATTLARGQVVIEAEQKDKYEDKILGGTVQVGFIQFPRSQNIKAKVDTGASISSLHGEDIRIDKQNNRVSFRAPFLSNNTLTVPLVTNQAVKSPDGGIQYRPVIMLDIQINNQKISGVEFNINDRAHMSHDVLIGQNVLERGKFLINPSMESQDIDWDYIHQLLNENSEQEDNIKRDEVLEQLYKLINETDLSFRDLIKYVKVNDHAAKDRVA
jgi:hypothetical protein